MQFSSAPPKYNEAVTNQYNSNEVNLNQITIEDRFRTIVQKYEISRLFSDKLQILKNFKVVFVFDDSGSMNTVLQDSPLNKSNSLIKATRWDELQYFANISIEIAALFSPTNGCDVYFLNRYPSVVKNITSADQLKNNFTPPPNGYTPLTQTLQKVLNDNANTRDERKLLVIICTDGEPTDTNGKTNIQEFKKCLLSRSANIFTTIVACTDDDQSVAYLNNFDRTMKNLDVVDDYRSEKNEVLKARGHNFSFTFGDYVVKSLIGSIDPELDNLDEKYSKRICGSCLIS